MFCKFTSMENIDKESIGQIVAEDYSTYKIFENLHIDYYNKGKQTLREAANENKIDLQSIKNEMMKTKDSQSEEDRDFNSMDLDTLSDYIIKTYHQYADKQIQVIKPTIEKVCQQHGEQYPVLPEIKKLFDSAAGIIVVHQKKEELILFPFIRKMADAKKNNKEFIKPRATKSVESPVDMLTHEHTQQGEIFQRIAELSQDYTFPDLDGTFHETLGLLKGFEINLHKHLHLENNILFPKALRLEKELTV